MRVENLKVWAALAVATMSAATFMVVVALLAGTKPAEAAFPGTNGKIAFTRCLLRGLGVERGHPTPHHKEHQMAHPHHTLSLDHLEEALRPCSSAS
jgi:hypothetical protein